MHSAEFSKADTHILAKIKALDARVVALEKLLAPPPLKLSRWVREELPGTDPGDECGCGEC